MHGDESASGIQNLFPTSQKQDNIKKKKKSDSTLHGIRHGKCVQHIFVCLDTLSDIFMYD